MYSMADLTLNILLTAQDGASSVVNSVGGAISNLASGNVLGAVGIAAAAAGAALVGIGVASVQVAAQYQQSMNMVQALTGSNTQQMQQYDASLKQLAVDAGVAPNALAQGLYNVLSAGHSGADGMNILKLATEDAKIGMTDATVTTNALTNILNSFSVKAGDVTRVNGEMLQTVTLGKATFAQYATTITNAASASVQFGVSMETMNAAWATLTSSGISAAHATTDYSQSLKVMYGNIGTVTASLQKNGIAFDEAKFNTMSYGDKVVYLNNALEQARAKHVNITGATIQAQQAIQTIAQHIDTYKNNLAALSDKQAMAQKTQEAWAITQQGFSQQMDRLNASIQVAMINIGNALLPILGQMVGWLTNVVSSFTDWENHTHAVENAAKALSSGLQNVGNMASQVANFFRQNQVAADLLKGSLAAVAVVVGVGLVSAFYSWAAAAWTAAAGVIAATWPVLAIAAAIGGLVAVFLWLYNSVKPFRDFMNQVGAALMNVWNIIVTNVSPAFQQFGAFLQASFMPIWQQLVQTWQTQVIPAWNSMSAAIQPILPQLQQFGLFLASVVGAALLTVTGLIGGLIGALGGLLTGIAVIIGGIATFIAGVIQYISGIIAFFVDLFTGKWDKLGSDLATIAGGIVKMFQGMWQAIEGVFIGAINGIIGLMNGFMAGIIGPLNTVLSAAHQATISVGQIPMLTVSASGGITTMPVYHPIGQQKSSTPKLPNTASIKSFGSLPTTMPQTTPVSIPSSSLAPVTGAINTASGKSAAHHAAKQTTSAAHHKATLAAHAARHAQAAAHHKKLVDTIVSTSSKECPSTSAITTALGVALPDYATGTGYVHNAPISQQAPSKGPAVHHIEVHIHTNSKDPKEHGREAAEEVKKHMGKMLRGQAVSPRFTSGGNR